VYLIPFFGTMVLSDITPGKVQEYRLERIQNPRKGKPPARKTLAQELVTLRQVLKTALRHGWLQFVPDFSPPYKTSGKISHRAWFSPEEYRRLYEATRERAKKPLNNRWRWACEQLHDYVLFMANTGLRPDEAAGIQYRDVAVVKDASTGEIILEIEVRGKRGVGYCKSTAGAVVERYAYDPYGRTTVYDGSFANAAAVSAYGNPFLHQGLPLDAESGQFHNRFRQYDPRLGRFAQRDPLKYVDGPSMYQYVGDNPLYWVDPLGLELLVGGTDQERSQVEGWLQELVPDATVVAVGPTGVVTLPPPPPPASGPTTQPSDSKPQPARDLLRRLIDSDRQIVITIEPVKHSETKRRPKNGRINVIITRFKKDRIVTFTDGTKGLAALWEVLWHELVHADHDVSDTDNSDSCEEERETIRQTNALTGGKVAKARDPNSHDACKGKK